MIEDILKTIPLFSSLPGREIQNLAESLPPVEFPAQATVFVEGQRDDYIYILLEGKVEIVKALNEEEERILAVQSAGSLLGEMSLFSPDGSHTASVRALTPLHMLQMTRAEFDALLHRQPRLAYDIVRLLSRRLEGSEDLTIQDLREKNRQLTRAYEELKNTHEQLVAAQAQIIEKEKLEHELAIAREIQRSILPHTLPHEPGYDFGALMVPARAVGGDFYDFIHLGNHQLGVVIGDVSDKGVPAAIFMALTYSMVRAEVSRSRTPGEILRAVNRDLLKINVSGMYVTVLYGHFDCLTGKFEYARAGHPPPVVIDGANQPVPVPVQAGHPLGLFNELKLDEEQITIPKDGLALLYSDGITEAVDQTNAFFGLSNLMTTLQASQISSASAVCNLLWDKVNSYVAASPAQDDFTAVTIIGKRR